MKVGFIGAGNMAAALARGWGDPVLCTDSGSGRAQALADELGGEAVGSNYELAVNADVVVLAHKPAQLDAGRPRGRAGRARRRLPARSHHARQLHDAYPDTPVVRVQPNTPAEVGRGVTLLAEPAEDPLGSEVEELFECVGIVVRLPESLLDAAAACSGVGPAYWALVAEAWVDAAIRRGIPAAQAQRLVTETMAGSAELLRARDHDTFRLRREVTSPGRDDRAGPGRARARRRARRLLRRHGRRAGTRLMEQLADFVAALVLVYTICIVGWVVLSLVFSLGVRVPYNRFVSGIMDFLRDVSNPFLNLFRRLPLQIGPLDLTPMVAIIVLQIGGGIIVGLIDPSR